MSEANFCNEIRKECRKRGAYVLKVHADDFQEAAVDFYICYKGRFVAVEAKAGKGTAMPHQLQVLTRVRNSGGIGVVIGHIADFRQLLDDLDDASGLDKKLKFL